MSKTVPYEESKKGALSCLKKYLIKNLKKNLIKNLKKVPYHV